MEILLIIFVSMLFIGSIIFSVFYIRMKYRAYDLDQTIKEMIEEKKILIDGALAYFRNKYCNDFDETVYRTIKLKVDFIRGLIKNRAYDKQLYYYDRLYKMLYETEARLISTPDNVSAIIAPLNNIKDEIVSEQITFLKENSDF